MKESLLHQQEAIPVSRLAFVDNLRIFLTLSVIVHHTAVTYGPLGSWYYHEQTDGLIQKLTLVPLVCFNQSYFMGFFFLLSGLFVPSSFDRRGLRGFLKERLMRLGIPLVVFSFLVQPCLSYPHFVIHEGLKTPFLAFCWERIADLKHVGPGPLWFVVTLLGMDLSYAMIRALWPSLDSPRFPLTGRSVAKYTAGLLMVSFLVRLWFPADTWVAFFQLAFYPQYISLFIVGVWAGRNDWLTQLPEAVGRAGLRMALGAIPLWYLVGVLGGALRGQVDVFKGGLHWQALAYCGWECLTCAGLCTGLTVIFRRRFNAQGPVLRAMAQNVYAVYVTHAVVLVFIEYKLSGLPWHPMIKFFLVSGLAIPACFLFTHFLLRRFPGMKRVL